MKQLLIVLFMSSALIGIANAEQQQASAAAPPDGGLPFDTPPNASLDVEPFVIGPQDVLAIDVWREADLTVKSTVRPDGKIGLPLLGDFQAAGLTTTELKDRIAEGYKQYVSAPQVTVIVVEVHSHVVHVTGSVAKPGIYQIGGPLTVIELLARAGGLSEFAKSRDIVVIRTDGGKTRRFRFNYNSFVDGDNLQQNIPLRSGDMIVVP